MAMDNPQLGAEGPVGKCLPYMLQQHSNCNLFTGMEVTLIPSFPLPPIAD